MCIEFTLKSGNSIPLKKIKRGEMKIKRKGSREFSTWNIEESIYPFSVDPVRYDVELPYMNFFDLQELFGFNN